MDRNVLRNKPLFGFWRNRQKPFSFYGKQCVEGKQDVFRPLDPVAQRHENPSVIEAVRGGAEERQEISAPLPRGF